MLGDGLKGGSLSRDLASVNTAAGELNGRQNYNVLAGVVDIDRDARKREDLSRWHVTGYIAIELIAVLIPLDRVQDLIVQVEVALEAGVLVPHHGAGDAKFHQVQRKATLQ
jgi:hypothetical protein